MSKHMHKKTSTWTVCRRFLQQNGGDCRPVLQQSSTTVPQTVHKVDHMSVQLEE